MADAGKFDMALEDIIKKTGRTGGRGRGRGGARSRGRSAVRGVFRSAARRGGVGFKTRSLEAGTRVGGIPAGKWQHDQFSGGRTRTLSGSGVGGANATTLLRVSNLDYGVSDSDIKELFADFGLLRKSQIHYDKSGRSLGTADVIFERRTDAVRAFKQYNNVPLDGRPMKIEFVGANTASTSGVRGRLGVAAGTAGGRGATRARRGTTSGRGGRGAGGGRGAKKQPTQAELDAELDAYVNKSL